MIITPVDTSCIFISLGKQSELLRPVAAPAFRASRLYWTLTLLHPFPFYSFILDPKID